MKLTVSIQPAAAADGRLQGMRFNNFWTYRRIILSQNFFRAARSSRRNVLSDKIGQLPPFGPYMAEFDITYQCNCRCRMCQRWNDPRPETLALSDYRRLAGEFREMAVHQISVAGGEPLMRKDVFDIIHTFARQGLSVNLCTNGMLLEKYSSRVIDSGATCVTVSLDGATAESHDAIRGIQGSYNQIDRGIRSILAVAYSKRPVLRVRMTISSLNQHEIGTFYKNWHRVADDVLLQPVHHCGDAFYTGMQSNELTLNPSVLKGQLEGTPFRRDGYMRTLINSLNHSDGAYPLNPCYAGVLMVRIDPWGNVYPCLEQHVRVGSVRNRSFKSVWHSPAFAAERERLRTRRLCRCWYNNTALIGHWANRLRRTGLSATDLRARPKWPAESQKRFHVTKQSN
jgi:MoaA/NifB/PqqE/SkfB family radical SAM enzyme